MSTKLVCPKCHLPSPITPVYISISDILSYSEGIQANSRQVVPVLMNYRWGSEDSRYGIIHCQSCDNLFIAAHFNGDWIAVYPMSTKPVAPEIPDPTKSEYNEACLCFTIGAYRGCIVMCMTALESMWRAQGCSGLKDLKDKDIISGSLYNRSNEVRYWAGAIKHEQPTAPTREDTEELLSYAENVLYNVYVEPIRFEALKKKREEQKKK